jgi:hypothetical protein
MSRGMEEIDQIGHLGLNAESVAESEARPKLPTARLLQET